MPNTTLNYYNQNAQTFSDSTLNVDMSALYREFLPYVVQNGHVLDAGCGSARDAAYFKSQGFSVSAFDASPALAELASSYLQQPVEVKTFQELECVNKYDGIWCCASLLHVPKAELPQVFLNLQNALKPNGVLYVSFKYGTQEREHNGREFTDLTEQLLSSLLNQHTQLSIIKHWQSVDQRPGRESEVWLNALITHSKAKL
ncbi:MULTISPECIES: class I SAM-dependent methyltransferase [Pseudoalteromonas]|uniref:class I SAM-dependent methyltransferase n=1 Tax=Pseudoalteromonas TaxID=53246 RepID=UPI0002CBDD4B|nr:MULTISPECIES: class I SAM-dependent methyltransferase [Pseudoalteromonas]ENN97387.1 tellurite resistance protein-related protein [Pseudoalteromonas agarivorans S816]TMS64110.1 class I SAM-dependent methyltransferase [Pseudoalteromonas sp. S1691]TMS67512.1 class I SAM-dependent methyltransferase [Pseudoalteromonas sp. S1731]TMS73632.1 class I SAM-dependent methyltransferase [Pseudoalteromonas sp. S1941]TMS75813.1 class I SAM-dependent methyltransferase [Pseudoalteromonas sp. S1690]